ncbi:MAG: hypothetical protein ABI655_04600 [Phenylobacterium sp.]
MTDLDPKKARRDKLAGRAVIVVLGLVILAYLVVTFVHFDR